MKNTIQNLKSVIAVAKGSKLADLVIKNAQIVNVLSEEIYQADVAVYKGYIVGVGLGYKAKQEIDAKGYYLVPGLIDGHVHLESSMMLPSEFAKSVLPSGTTAVVTDPHEIANVLGLNGIKLMYKNSRDIGLDVFFTLSSCVPATSFETSGANLSAKQLTSLMDKKWVFGLAEMMNYVGVVQENKEVLSKLLLAKEFNKTIDGHAPMLSGKELNAYIASGVKSDHECISLEEATEKLRLGMHIMIREGTAAKNLDALMPLLNTAAARRCMFVTDDRHPSDLAEHINGMVRRCVASGVNPIKAIQCASLNTAQYFGLNELGAIAPGYKADFMLLPNLTTFKPHKVFKNGTLVAQEGKNLLSSKCAIQTFANSVNVGKISLDDFRITPLSNMVKTIEIIPGQLITNFVLSDIKIEDGNAVSNVKNDTLKICVIERHHGTGNIGKGFIKGFGLKSGAIASTVAHDSHNLIVIGTNDKDMYLAAKELLECGGGKVVVNDGKVLAKLALPIAGLMSEKDLSQVKRECVQLEKSVKKLGAKIVDPFMTMGFVSLPVIPSLKITDKGLFDTNVFKFVDLFENNHKQ